MAAKSEKTVKKVTKIPNATVEIEIEEKEGSEAPTQVVADAEVKAQDTEGEGEEKEEPEATGEGEEETENTPTESQGDEEKEKGKDDEDEDGETEEEKVAEQNDNSGPSWKNIFLIILIAVPVGFLMFGGLLYFAGDFKIGSLNKKEPPKTINIPTATTTPTPGDIDKAKYQIEVLNGSGIAGEAAAVQEMLEEEGFVVGSIGNADDSDYTTTIISAGNDIDAEFVNALSDTLEERGPTKVEEAESDQEADILVTVGSSKD